MGEFTKSKLDGKQTNGGRKMKILEHIKKALKNRQYRKNEKKFADEIRAVKEFEKEVMRKKAEFPIEIRVMEKEVKRRRQALRTKPETQI